MPTLVKDMMTYDPVRLGEESTVADAARVMRDYDIGDVLVTRYGKLAGVVTDRDVTVRAIANGLDPDTTPLVSILSADPVCVEPADDAAHAVALMRAHALRRLPVCAGDRLVGIVSLGDLTETTDAGAALAEICAAPANR